MYSILARGMAGCETPSGIPSAAQQPVWLMGVPPDAGPAGLTLRYLPTGGGNPFVIGKEPYQRVMDMMRECVRISLARDGVTD